MLHGLLDRAGPDEAEVGVPGTHRLGRDQAADIRVGAVDVQPLVAEGIGKPAVLERDDLGAEDVAVEGVRAIPVADRDDDVVEREPQSSRSQYSTPLSRRTMTSSASLPVQSPILSLSG